MSTPISIAIVDDFDIVVAGVAAMLDPFDEVAVVHLVTDEPIRREVDLVLFDTFAQTEAHGEAVAAVAASPFCRALAIYTWNLDTALVANARARGIRGYFSKGWPAERLVAAIVAVHEGRTVLPSEPVTNADPNDQLRWPGQAEGLTGREAQVVALVVAGLSNAEIAERLFLSINSIKTHIRTAYAKMQVTSRSQAVLWGIDHGMRVEASAVDAWVT